MKGSSEKKGTHKQSESEAQNINTITTAFHYTWNEACKNIKMTPTCMHTHTRAHTNTNAHISTLAAPALWEIHIQTDYVGLLGGLVHGPGNHTDSGFARLVVHNTAEHHTIIPVISTDGELAVH